MYEKQGAPPCGALNSYLWNNCVGEIADAIEDIALLRAEELDFGNISQKQLACAELRSIRLERTPVIAVDADTCISVQKFSVSSSCMPSAELRTGKRENSSGHPAS